MKALIQISYPAQFSGYRAKQPTHRVEHKVFRTLSPLITLLGQHYYGSSDSSVTFFAAPGEDDSAVDVAALETAVRELAASAPSKYDASGANNTNFKQEMAAWRNVASEKLIVATDRLLPY